MSVLMESNRYSCQILMKLEFYRQIKKIPNFMKIRPLGTFLRDKPAVVGTH